MLLDMTEVPVGCRTGLTWQAWENERLW